MKTQLHKTFFFKLVCTLVLFLGLFQSSFAAVPTISYTSPAAYTQGTAIATLSPTTGGGAVSGFAYNTTAASSYTVGSNPWHLVFDASGNLYVANLNSNTVSKITSAGVVSTFINTNLSNPAGIAINASGNFYVANYNGGANGSITIYNSSGTYQSTIASGGLPTGIAVDASGNIWLADYGNGLEEFSSIGTLLQTITVATARGVYIDVSGNIYVSIQQSGNVNKYSSTGAYISTIVTGLNAPYGVYVDGSGDIYAVNGGGNSVAINTSTGTLITTFSGTGISTPTDARTDASGNLYVSNYGNNTVTKYAPTGGYFINKPLPPGLTLNYSNGQITGTPTIPFASTSYTVTAYNASGAGTSNTFTLSVNPPAPTTTGATDCSSGGAVTVSAAGETTTGGTYNFYTASTGGTLLQSTTSNTYTSTITATTTYYVSYTVNGTTSASRTAVTATLSNAPVLSTAPTGSGLTFSYPFTGNANDASSAGNNGAIYTSGVTLTNDRFGEASSAYSFSGSNATGASGYIYTTAAAAAGPNNFTINIWFKTTTAGGLLIGFGSTQDNGNSGSHDRKIYMSSTGQIIFGVYNSATDTVCTPSGTNYADGNWHMATGTFSSTTGMALYLDGKEISANASYTTAQPFSGYWRIGEDSMSGWPGASSNFAFTGSLDDVCVYTSSITPATIYTLYGAGSPAVCYGSPLALQANTVSGATYSWSGPNSYTSTTQNPIVAASASYSNLGTYVLTVTTTATGCTYTQNVIPQIQAEPSPAFTTTASVATGAASTITYTATIISGHTYSWNFGGGTQSPSTTNGTGPYSVTWSTAGPKTITLTETNATGCSTVYTQSVIVGGQSVTAANYAFNQNISLNTSAITNGGISTNLSNFPALVYIQENALINNPTTCGNNIRFPSGGTNGYDFAFTMQGSSTELYYQIESYNSTTGTLLVWVNVPSITKANAALTFYFGSLTPNHSTTFTQNCWPSDYAAVYHFDEGSTTAAIVDATSNARNATQTGTTLAVGETHNAANLTTANSAYTFNGTSSNITYSSGITIPTSFTLSAWVNLSATGYDQKVMTNQVTSGNGYKLGVYTNNIAESETNGGGLTRYATPTAPTLGTGSWHYLQSVFTGSTLCTYVDGLQYAIVTVGGNSSSTNPFYIGVGEGGNQLYFHGTISEARVSSLAKTPDWINAEYYNQSNPLTFTTVSTTINDNATNAAAIGASIMYTWVGSSNSSTDPTVASNWYCTGAVTSTGVTTGSYNILPPQDGSESLSIPAGTYYPVWPSGTLTIPVYSLVFGAGAQMYLNGNTFTIGCHVYNNGSPGGTISSGSSSSSTVLPTTTGGLTFNGSGYMSGSIQYLYGATNSTVNLANLTEANISSTGSLNITGGPVNVYNTFGSTLGNITIAASGTLTLVSTAAGSANVDQLPSANSITGNVSVQRYFPGGASAYRSYRLLTLPVNINTLTTTQSTTEGFIDLTSLNSGIITAGPGSGFSYTTATSNPLMYLYDENRAQNFTAFVAGKNVGIYSLVGSTTYKDIYYPKGGTAASVPTASAEIPVGNSVQVYYVGPYVASPVLTATVPAAATTTATGYLNQGTIPIYIFSTAAKAMSYSPAVNTLPKQGLGLNQVGNPYASTIDLDSVYFDNKTGSTAIGPIFWELKEPNNTFLAYSANHTGSSTGSEAYIASGQGFYAQAITTTSALTFYEKEKINVQLGTSTSPVLIFSQKQPEENAISAAEIPPSGLSGLHLQITKDSATYTQTGIYFNGAWSDKYIPTEDAIDLDGLAPKVYLSSFSTDNIRLCINQLGNYTNGKVVPLYASATASGSYTISLADIKNIDPLYHIYLRDHKLNDSVDVRTNSYTFNINTGDTTSYGANRFDIKFERETLPPYQLLTFAGQKVTTGVQLNWTANNAGNYTGYVLQKQDANNVFNQIYSIQSNNGSTYTFVDTKPIVGANVYRLAQNDVNGNISYSSTVTIGYNDVSSNGYFSVYPNPAKDILNVLINSTPSTDANYTADIYNTSGVSIDHRVLNTFTWTEDISSYKEGVYIMVLKDTNGNVLAKTKFIKTK